MKQEKRHTYTHLMLERLINIHKEIRDGHYPNTTELARKFNDGKGTATISRDIEFLRDRFYAPIEYDYSRKGYYYTENFEMPINNLSSEKLQTLFAAKHLLEHFKDTPLYEEISNIIDFLTETSLEIDSTFLKRVTLSPVPKFLVDKNLIAEIYRALQENAIIEFDYSGRWNQEISHRKVHPYQLILEDGKYFLYGYSEERSDVRIFSLGNMQNLLVTKETFTLPKDFEFQNRSGGGFFGTFASNFKDEYKIEFYENAREMVKSCLWAENQVIEDDENRKCTIITFTSTQTSKVEEWVLSQGMYAKPLAPKWLVDSWKEHIKGLCKLAGM